MAEKQYAITLRNETEENEKAKTTATTQNGQSADGKTDEKGFKFTKATALKGFAVSVADRVVSSNINTISLRTGYEEKQQRIQYNYQIGKRGAVYLGALAHGVKSGNIGAPLFGIALSLVNTAVNYAIRQQEVNYSRQVENNSIFLNQIRMGAGLNREGKTR
jgi:hypothetical protein